MALSVKVKKSYPGFTLDAEFDSSSKRIGILGASGCGKSLTLRSIAGIEKPDGGKICFGDTVWFDTKSKTNVKPAKRKVGYLFQNYALFPNMTVEQNIAAPIKSDADRTKTVHDILKKFGLWEVRDHRPDEISGGQQQRTALARMLTCDPDLLLLDEPFSAMDTFLREGMRLELIRLLDEYDKTVIIVSHDRDEIYQMCDHLILMDNGSVIAQGPVDELFDHPGTVAAARLTGCKNISRIRKIDDHQILALDWGDLELTTSETVTEDVAFAGIRAHDFIPGNHGVNVINCGQATISRLPFEWYITLENGLWWKQSRNLDESLTDNIIPPNISIMPDKIILLKK